MDDKDRKILSSLEAMCARREYCSHDILAKALQKTEGDGDRAAGMLESLVRDGFVDDRRYAAAFAREKSALTGWGPIKIRYALSAKHIDRSIVDSALEEASDGKAEEKLKKLLEARKKALAGDPQARLKLIRYALSRGYEYSQIEKLV